MPAALPLPAEEYLTWLAVERGRSANTLAAYRRDLAGWVGWLAERGRRVEDASADDVTAYVGHLRSAGRAPASVARSLVAVRSLHAFCAEEGLTATDPSADVAPPRVPRGLPKPLTEDEVVALLGAVVGTDATARRDRASSRCSTEPACGSPSCAACRSATSISTRVSCACSGRARRSEWSRWAGTPGRRSTTGSALTAARAWSPRAGARRGDAEAVFLGVRGARLRRQAAWEVVKVHGERVGVGDRLSPHVLRHSCATHLLDHGADVRVVQELLGHASVATTQVYTQVSTERIRAVYEAAHPRARRPA